MKKTTVEMDKYLFCKKCKEHLRHGMSKWCWECGDERRRGQHKKSNKKYIRRQIDEGIKSRKIEIVRQ